MSQDLPAEGPYILQREDKLTEIVRRLVKANAPDRVYLFASKTRGDTGLDSDYDLLLVVRDDAPPEQRRSRLAYEVLWYPALLPMCSYARIATSNGVAAWPLPSRPRCCVKGECFMPHDPVPFAGHLIEGA